MFHPSLAIDQAVLECSPSNTPEQLKKVEQMGDGNEQKQSMGW
jgi:hypothetical protein